jgi:hypothetical protein
MDDIELTQKICALDWKVDLDSKSVSSPPFFFELAYLEDGGIDIHLGKKLPKDFRRLPSAVILDILRGVKEKVEAALDGSPNWWSLRRMKAKHGLTGRRIAEICGKSPAQVRKWLMTPDTPSSSPIPLSDWKLLRLELGEK